MTALDVPVADVVGHDWGANVAWGLAAWHPDRVRTLTAVSVPHPTAYTLAFRADPEQKERSAYIRLFWQTGKAEEVLLADDARRLRRMLSGGEHDTGVPVEAIDEYVAVLSAPGALTAALNWYRAIPLSRRDPVPTPTAPALFVWSDRDTALTRDAAERAPLHLWGPFCYAELQGVSHWIPDEAPAALAELLLEHILGP
jgi:pimeloyl-ACP methyl ester carboxylesterase